MVDWTTFGSWIIEGLIVAGFVIAGFYIGMRLFGDKIGRAQFEVAPDFEGPAPESVPEPSVDAPSVSIEQFMAQQHGTGRTLRDLPVNYAFDFDAGDRVTVALNMPVAMLENDEDLSSAWIDTIGWARLEYLQKTLPDAQNAPAPPDDAADLETVDPEQLKHQLTQVLGRLQVSAERRQGLRAALHDGLSEAAPQGGDPVEDAMAPRSN